jgi:hypothetical protein
VPRSEHSYTQRPPHPVRIGVSPSEIADDLVCLLCMCVAALIVAYFAALSRAFKAMS